MDKYLTSDHKRASEGNFSKSKQSTLYELKGVVNVDEILSLKAKLKNRQLADEDVLVCLRRLSKKIPPRNVLESTRIERRIKKLTKHKSNKEISALASSILKTWHNFYSSKNRLPRVDVKCDEQTTRIRRSSRQHLCVCLKTASDKQSRHNLVECLEREVFSRTRILLKYTPMMRRVSSLMKEDEEIKAKLLDKSLGVEQFVDELLNNRR